MFIQKRGNEMAKKFRNFKDARKFVHSLNLKSKSEWQVFCKSGKRPDDIPYKPHDNYKNKGWISWGDFLGSGTIAPHLIEFREFESAREFVRKLKLETQNEWRRYIKSGKKPKDIPSNPGGTYKNEGWKGFGDWLGTGSIAPQDREYISFEKARDFVRKLKLKNRDDWVRFCKSNKKPNDIPSVPGRAYKNKGWKGWGNFLGTGTVATHQRKYRSFDDARKFVHSLNFNGEQEWRVFIKSGNKPNDIPSAPDKIYKNKGWISWGDWYGTGTVSAQIISKNYLPFKEARIEARKLSIELGIKTREQWVDAKRKGLIPDNLPLYPWSRYSKRGRNEKEI